MTPTDLAITFSLYWAGFLFLGWLAGALWHWLVQLRRQGRARRAVANFRRYY